MPCKDSDEPAAKRRVNALTNILKRNLEHIEKEKRDVIIEYILQSASESNIKHFFHAFELISQLKKIGIDAILFGSTINMIFSGTSSINTKYEIINHAHELPLEIRQFILTFLGYIFEGSTVIEPDIYINAPYIVEHENIPQSVQEEIKNYEQRPPCDIDIYIPVPADISSNGVEYRRLINTVTNYIVNRCGSEVTESESYWDSEDSHLCRSIFKYINGDKVKIVDLVFGPIESLTDVSISCCDTLSSLYSFIGDDGYITIKSRMKQVPLHIILMEAATHPIASVNRPGITHLNRDWAMLRATTQKNGHPRMVRIRDYFICKTMIDDTMDDVSDYLTLFKILRKKGRTDIIDTLMLIGN